MIQLVARECALFIVYDIITEDIDIILETYDDIDEPFKRQMIPFELNSTSSKMGDWNPLCWPVANQFVSIASCSPTYMNFGNK